MLDDDQVHARRPRRERREPRLTYTLDQLRALVSAPSWQARLDALRAVKAHNDSEAPRP